MVSSHLSKFETFLLQPNKDILSHVQFSASMTPKCPSLLDCLALPSHLANRLSSDRGNIHLIKIHYLLEHPFHQFCSGKNQLKIIKHFEGHQHLWL